MQDDTKIARPRGRPRSFEHAKALEQVAGAFRRRGFSATSLDDLSEATGLNRPSLYAAFGDKKAMYLKSLEDLKGRLTTGFGQLIDANLELPAALKRMFRNSIDAYVGGEHGPQGCLAISTATVEATGDEDIQTALREIVTLMDRSLATLFERAGMPDAALRAQLAASLLHSLSMRARAGQPRKVLDDLAQHAIQQLTGPAV